MSQNEKDGKQSQQPTRPKEQPPKPKGQPTRPKERSYEGDGKLNESWGTGPRSPKNEKGK